MCKDVNKQARIEFPCRDDGGENRQRGKEELRHTDSILDDESSKLRGIRRIWEP